MEFRRVLFRSARIDQGRVEAAQGAVQLADRRRAEAFGERAAQQQFVGHLPAQSDLAGTLAAEGRVVRIALGQAQVQALAQPARSEEHTSELQSLMRISYAVFCLKKKNRKKTQ